MTKREQIAAMAMQGLLSSPDVLPIHIDNDHLLERKIAKVAITIADALIKQLEKTDVPKAPEIIDTHG